MTISNYSRPQQRIFQQLDITPPATTSRINAIVIGPTYFVQRYGWEERAGTTFDTAGQALPYDFVDDMGASAVLGDTTYTLDTQSVRVFAEDVEALLADIEANISFDSTRKVITLSTNDFKGSGTLNAALDGRPVQAGDVVDVEVTGGTFFRRKVQSFTADNVLVLDQAVPGSGLESVQFLYVHSGEIDQDVLTVGATTVTTDASIGLAIPGKDSAAPLVDGKGELFVQYRALMAPPADEGYLTIHTTSDIEDQLGTICLDNDLAYAASRALHGSGGQRIYALRVQTDDSQGFTQALTKISSTDYTYALAPITTDLDAQLVVASHVGAMSQPEVKNFRRAYLGYDSPGQYEVLSGAAFTPAAFGGDANRHITISEGGLIAAGVTAGYIFTTGGTDYTVQERLSDTELVLTGAGTTTGTWTIDAPDNAVGTTAAVKARSQAIGDRRAANVWTHQGTNFVEGQFQRIPNRYLAAEIAGLRTALRPQQGLTRTEVQTITNASAMHTLFTQDQLDEIAAAGTFIVTQDVESGDTFIRHQLTTDTSSGSLFYEDSVGTNLDDLSFQIKDAVEGYIGKRNVTPATVSEVRGVVRDILQTTTEADAGDQAGPQIISYQDLVVRAHPVLKDRIEISVQVEMPLPLNNIDTYIRASVGLTI